MYTSFLCWGQTQKRLRDMNRFNIPIVNDFAIAECVGVGFGVHGTDCDHDLVHEFAPLVVGHLNYTQLVKRSQMDLLARYFL